MTMDFPEENEAGTLTQPQPVDSQDVPENRDPEGHRKRPPGCGCLIAFLVGFSISQTFNALFFNSVLDAAALFGIALLSTAIYLRKRYGRPVLRQKVLLGIMAILIVVGLPGVGFFRDEEEARETIRAFYIPSPAMLPTLRIKDRVFAHLKAYEEHPPERGDMVVFKVPARIPEYDPEKPIWVKRVAAVGGDKVEIVSGELWINGAPYMDHPFLSQNHYYAKLAKGKEFSGTIVGEGQVFLLGDNSGNSYDSRYWGSAPESSIIGKVVFRFWPPSRIGWITEESGVHELLEEASDPRPPITARPSE